MSAKPETKDATEYAYLHEPEFAFQAGKPYKFTPAKPLDGTVGFEGTYVLIGKTNNLDDWKNYIVLAYADQDSSEVIIYPSRTARAIVVDVKAGYSTGDIDLVWAKLGDEIYKHWRPDGLAKHAAKGGGEDDRSHPGGGREGPPGGGHGPVIITGKP